MDAGSTVNIVWSVLVALVGGLAWLFKLHGDVRVLKSELKGEVELRRELKDRITGIESEIREKLDYIIEQLGRKADR